MNPLIPLSIDVPDIAGNFFRGQQDQAFQQEQQSKNALRAALQQYGAAASQGDRNALAELAKFDPAMVSGLQNDVSGRAVDQQQIAASKNSMTNDDRRYEIERKKAAEFSQEHVAQMSALQRQQTAEANDKLAAAAATLETEKDWNAYFGRKDASPDEKKMVGLWNKKRTFMAETAGLKDTLDRMSGGDQPEDVKKYQFAVSQGETRPFTAWNLEQKRSGANRVTTSVSTGDNNLPKPSPGSVNVPQPDGTFVQAPVAGGTQTQLPAELAARVGLAEDSIRQLPGLIQQAQDGDLTGVWDYLKGVSGRGKQGVARRDTAAASEAVTRMLTGAGMPANEVAREANMYAVQPWDDAPTVTSKLQQLQRRLIEITSQAKQGREGVAVDPQTGFGIQGPAAGPQPGNDEDLFRKYGVQ